MIRGLYAAAAGMLSAFQRQEVNSNNLSNVNTPGFKRDLMPVREGQELGEVRTMNGMFAVPYATSGARTWLGTVGTGALNDPVVADFANGDVRDTGEELDLALIGSGFFEMQSPSGDVFYTRAGQFSRDSVGRLVGPDGSFLMGDDGPIRVGQGSVTIDADGTVLSDGEEVGILRVMTFEPNTAMRKVGDNGFVAADVQARPRFVDAEGTVVQQGALEGSNVDPTRAVVEMMSAMRSYEAAQRMVQLNDSILERAVNDLGRL